MSDWDIYGVCKCGYKERAPFGRLHHIHKTVCPDCSNHKSNWDLETMRYISHVKLLRPSTWGSGVWETSPEE